MTETLTPEGVPIPTIGRIVVYRSKTGSYVMPAIVAATIDTLHQPHVEAGHMHPITDEMHVHLIVFTAGFPGHISMQTLRDHPELADPRRANIPSGGTYQEWDIGWSADASAAGCWSWPKRT